MEQLLTVITGDLRTALLLIGVVLVGGIILWEVLQRRRAKRAEREYLKGPLGAAREDAEKGLRTDPLFRADGSRGGEEPPRSAAAESRSRDAAVREEPTLTLPEISTRDRLIEPPLIDLDEAIRATSSGPGLPVMQASEAAEPDAPSPDRSLPDLPKIDSPKLDSPQPDPSARGPSESASTAEISAEAAPRAPVIVDAAATPVPASASIAAGSSPNSPRLDLPNEDQRVIVALRVVARGGERFTGASLRQALQGEGFVHGDMAIFHRVMADGHILLSAASLTKPGNFDLATMDSSLFLGINVFAVLPGPLPGRDTVDKLLLAGHTLAQRLRGELHDSKGQPLTEARLAEMRREAAAAAG